MADTPDDQLFRDPREVMPVGWRRQLSGMSVEVLDLTPDARPRTARFCFDRALEDHELIKLQLVGERDERRELAEQAAERTDSALAGLVGRVAILYRPARDPERRRIDPRSRRSDAPTGGS